MPNPRDRDRCDALKTEAERTSSLAEGQALMRRAEDLRRGTGKGGDRTMGLPILRN
jgi:hypothetical protein